MMFMGKRIFKRVYHHFETWEEIEFNMWGVVGDKKEWLERAVSFTGDHELYGSYMKRVVSEWPISCENALTDANLNQRAWVGHAACALAINCPEDITRQAWGYLTDEQRLLANQEADSAIKLWQDAYIKGKGLCEDVGGQMLLEWDT